MPNEPLRSMRQDRLGPLVLRVFEQFPTETFMVRDVSSMIDYELREAQDSEVALRENVRRLMNAAVSTGEIFSRHKLESGEDVMRYTVRQESLLFYSATSPVPAYTQDMVDFYDEFPQTREVAPQTTPRRRLELRPEPTLTPTPTPTGISTDSPISQRAAAIHALVDSLVEDDGKDEEIKFLKARIAALETDLVALRKRQKAVQALFDN